MVNGNRLLILNKLKQSDNWISGEQISRETGISRVAVWKQIQALIEKGYPVQSGHKGYRITENRDTLSELEFRDDESILFFRELQSTMDEASRQHNSPGTESESYLVLADHQSGGVTRDDRIWDSPSGGIYLTFVLNKSMDLNEVPLMKKRGILTVLSTLHSFDITGLGYNPRGDIFLDGQKSAGILEEYHVRGSRIRWFALGLGLHVNDQPLHSEGMTSVFLHSGIILDRALVVKKLKECWDRALPLKAEKIENALEAWSLIG